MIFPANAYVSYSKVLVWIYLVDFAVILIFYKHLLSNFESYLSLFLIAVIQTLLIVPMLFWIMNKFITDEWSKYDV